MVHIYKAGSLQNMRLAILGVYGYVSVFIEIVRCNDTKLFLLVQ
jgi:hypothetical protein